MSGLRPELALLLLGCSSSEPAAILDRVLGGWADQTMELAGPAMTAALVVGGLSSRLCTLNAQGEDLMLVGEAPPLGDVLNDALGEPLVEEVTSLGEGVQRVTLAGLTIGDRESARLRYTSTTSAASTTVEVEALDGRQESGAGAIFGRMSFSVVDDCASSSGRVSGKAEWTDLDGRRHELSLPDDPSIRSGLAYDTTYPYLPTIGTVGWSARLDEQDRNVTTVDASELQVEPGVDTGQAPAALWPVLVSGGDWSTESRLLIDPGAAP